MKKFIKAIPGKDPDVGKYGFISLGIFRFLRKFGPQEIGQILMMGSYDDDLANTGCNAPTVDVCKKTIENLIECEAVEVYEVPNKP